MTVPLRVLIVEDSPDDAELLCWEIRRGGYDESIRLVDTAEAMRAALDEAEWDVIISDYSMPGFNGLSALRILQEKGLDLPFIVVSGTVGEDVAVEVMRAGANDYLMKDRLTRLVPAIERAIDHARSRRERRHAEQERDRHMRDLAGRVRELRCLYGVSRLIAEGRESIERLMEEAVHLIPGAFQFPEVTCARITLDGYETTSSSFSETERKLSADMVASGQVVGRVEVFLLDGRHARDEGPFLKEERELIDDLARQLGVMIERHRAEEKSRESEVRYRALFEGAGEGILVVDVETRRFMHANPAACGMLGYTREELMRLSATDIHPEESLDYVIAEFDAQARGNKALAEDIPCLRKDGTVFYADISAAAAVIDGRKCNVGFFIDITASKQAEEERRAATEKYRSMMDNVSLGVVMIGPDMEILEMNRQMKAWFPEVDPAEYPICYRTFNDPPLEDACDTCPTHKAFQDGQVHEAIMKRRRGEHTRVFRIVSSPIRDAEGNIVAATEMVEDITEREEAEKALKEAHDIINRSSSVAFTWKNQEGWPVEFVTQNVERLIGYTAEEFMKGTVRYIGCVHPDDLERVADEVVEFGSKGEASEFKHKPYRIITKDGSEKTISDWTFIARDNDGRITHYKGIVEDITERVSLEEQLLQAQKMEAVGRLAGGVAHDFNNMLGIIIGYGELAHGREHPQSPVRGDLERILDAARRSATLVRQLLAFARRQPVEPIVIDLNGVIDNSRKMLQRLVGEDIDVRFIPQDDLWAVKIDPGQIDQILANLSVNARDAVAGAGKFTVETENVFLDETYCRAHAECSPGKYVMMSFSDSGCGMDKETIKQIFEPFFTTKKEGKGTGLGLSTVYGIVRQNNGAINVYSEPGHGTVFKIYLPRHMGPTVGVSLDKTPKILTGTETILVVEDDEGMLKLCSAVLAKLGYTVHVAHRPEEAVALVEEHRGEIHLLITDVVMPGMNGKELQARLESLKPGIKTLFMSGYTANLIADRGVLAEGIQFLQKPFSVSSLSMKVRDVLNG